ncbi:MAG: ABC transporter permease subunit [Bacteroidetes bacterium]|nr:ABC transporter permease subunit [Bacteroidota bacterium]
MDGVLKIFKFELHNLSRSKWVILYAVFYFIITYGLFQFESSQSRVVVSLMNTTLLFIPLVSVVFGTMYLYHSREFIELLLSQPIQRTTIFWGLYMGITIPLSLGFVLGVGIPSVAYGMNKLEDVKVLGGLLTMGVFLTSIFVAFAFLLSIRHDDKMKGLGFSILVWFFFGVLYDALILTGSFVFADYPLEKAMLFLNFLNPIDIARTFLLLQLDISALMGYTGAVFSKFFGGWMGMTTALGVLVMWTLVPLLVALRIFRSKDF